MMNKLRNTFFYSFFALIFGLIPSESVFSQSISPAADGTGTIVNSDGSQFNIQGGSLSGDGANLFHSFQKFGLDANQIANFLSNPEIRNILGRVVGGDASIIQGLIRVTGGDANLFLMNPSGFVFGANAQLDVSGSFVVTTANGMKFGDRWFSASGVNDYSALVGEPSAFAFTNLNSGAIINQGNLSVQDGNTLGLIGGTVVSTGSLNAPGGNVVVTAVPGQNVVNLKIPGNVLSLEIKTTALGGDQPNQWNLPVTALPQLLTIGKVNSDQTKGLSAGDAVVQNVSAGNAIVWANGNLNLVESQLTTTGDLHLLADDTLFIRDSQSNPFIAESGGELVLRGNQSIDILALNHPQPALKSGGNLTLISNEDISGDAHFSSQGNVSFLTLTGEPANFVSIEDPIITSVGDVTFGDYTGVALKVEATGSIEGGNIRITGPDTTLSGSDPDIDILTSSPALILRAGLQLSDLQNRPNDPQSTGNTRFVSSRSFDTTGGFIQVGSIDTSSTNGVGGVVILSTLGTNGSITVNGDINTFSAVDSGGRVELTANGGDSNINVRGNINTSSSNGSGGAINLSTINGVGNINIEGNLNTSATGGDPDTSTNSEQGGLINIDAQGTGANIRIGGINTFSESGNAGEVNLLTFGREADITINNAITTQSNQGNGGVVNIFAQGDNGNITIGEGITTSSQSSGQGGDIFLNTNGNEGKIAIGGDINASSLFTNSQRGGNVNITALGNEASISIDGEINTTSQGDDGGNITLSTQGQDNLDGKITIQGDLNSSSSGGDQGNIGGDGGNINVSASGNDNAEASIFIGGDVNSSSDANPQISAVNDGGEIIIDSSQTGNGGNVTLEALGDIEVSAINTQGSNGFEFNQSDGNTLTLDPNLRIANGGDLVINTRNAFRATGVLDSSLINITQDLFDSAQVSITTQGANNGNATGGRIEIRIGENQLLTLFAQTDTSPSSITFGDVTNSPVPDLNFLGQTEGEAAASGRTTARGFQPIAQGGGFPNRVVGGIGDILGGNNVTNSLQAPRTNVGPDEAVDTQSRQSPTVTTDNTNIDGTNSQSNINPQEMASETRLEDEEEKLKDPCQNPEKFKESIIKIEDPKIKEDLLPQQELCQNQEEEDLQRSSPTEETDDEQI